MAGTTYKAGLFQIKNAAIRVRGGQTVAFAGQTVGPVTAQVTLGVPAGQLVGWAMIAAATNATIASAYVAGSPSSARPVFQPYSTGEYAKTRAGQYIMLGESSKIAGIANTLLKSPAGDSGSRRSINTKAKLDRSFKVTSINYVTGALSGSAKTYYWRDMGAAAAHPETAVTTQQDQVALPNISRAIPGEFTLSETGKAPTAKDYDKKTG